MLVSSIFSFPLNVFCLFVNKFRCTGPIYIVICISFKCGQSKILLLGKELMMISLNINLTNIIYKHNTHKQICTNRLRQKNFTITNTEKQIGRASSHDIFHLSISESENHQIFMLKRACEYILWTLIYIKIPCFLDLESQSFLKKNCGKRRKCW